MSETESFEQLMEIARYVLCNECGLLDNFGSLCLAHDNDCSDCQKSMVARIKAAHDREIRDTAQQAYHRGFEAGRHSMDAEHRAIAMRLRQLPLDGDDTYENLLSIGQAIWHDDFGCTLDGGSKLRDELVRLMGGVSDGTAEPMTTDEFIEYVEEDTRRLKSGASKAGDVDDTCACAGRGACAAGDGRDSGEQEVTNERLADDCGADSRGGSRGELVHMDGLVAYDVLDNERRKAVCELRKMRSCKEDHFEPELFFDGLYDALGCRAETGGDSGDQMCDRLVHLLGGDRPSGIDVLRAMEEREAEGRITDELREWMSTVLTSDDNAWTIADRIDAQFDRICAQQEAVLQETIDEVVDDRESEQLRIEKLVEQRDAARARTDELSDELLRVRRERDEARDECDRLKRDMLDEWVPRTSYEEKVEKYRRAYMESDAWRKSLQEKLNAMRDAITAALNG